MFLTVVKSESKLNYHESDAEILKKNIISCT